MELVSEEDKNLSKLLRAGNLGAFERILFAYEKGLFNYLYRITGNLEDAEDLTQEVFIKLYQYRIRIDPEKSLKSWLYTVATNVAYDWLRSKRIRATGPLYNNGREGFETIEDLPSYYHIEKVVDIAAALRRLKPIYKTVLVFFYKEGFGYKEIAYILGIPINTVKTYLRRAKESLKRELGENYGE